MKHFTEQARSALYEAQSAAGEFIGTEHLLVALARSPGVASIVLAHLGVSADRLQSLVPAGLGTNSSAPPFSPGAKRSLEMALDEALAHGDEAIGTAHVLLTWPVE